MEELSRVVEAYRDAELYLLRLIAGAVEGSGTQHHYMNQHRELTRILQLVEARLNQLAGHLDNAVLEELERVYAAAVREAITQTPTPVPSLIPTTAVEATAMETAGVIASQHHTILRTVQDRYREAAQTTLTRALVSGESNLQTVQAMLNRMADKGLTGFIDRAGRSWDMGTYADMAIRTGRMRALNQGHMDGWQHAGVELVRVSQHPASHPWCYPYQGELLAISGPAGPRVMTDRVTGKQITVTAVATFQEALAAGYHHPNCRHSEGAYIPGFTSHQPEKVDEAENEKQYEALQRQRQIERHIRQWKKREAVALTPQEKAYARRKVRSWQSAQREHVSRHNFLSRRYEREKLRTGKGGATSGPRPFTPPKPKPPQPTTPQSRNRHGGAGLSVADILKRENVQVGRPNLEPKKATTKPNASKTVSRVTPPERINGFINDTAAWDTLKAEPRRRYATLTDVPHTNRNSWKQIAQDANPKRTGKYNDPYNVNCVKVSHTVEARVRNLDLTAGRGTYNGVIPTNDVWDAIAADCKKYNIRQNNSVYAVTSAWRGPNGEVRNFYKAQSVKKGVKGGVNAQTLIDLNDSVPDGARGFARGRWQKKYGGGGHIWNWVKQDGKIRYFEAQTHEGFIDVEKRTDKLVRGSLEVFRVDDLTPTDELLGVIGVD